MKIKIIICFFISINAVCSQFVTEFNKSVESSKNNNYEEAINVLKAMSDEVINEPSQNKVKFYYQLGTLYCLVKDVNNCLSNLKEAYKYSKNDYKIKKNLELVYLLIDREQEKSQDPKNKDKKEESKKKPDYNKKFENQIMTFRYLENKILEKNFSREMNQVQNRCEKDW